MLAHTWDSYPSVSQYHYNTDAVYTAKTTAVPTSSTTYFVALAFHLILGGADRVRTYTAVLSSGLQPGALPLRRLLHKLWYSVRESNPSLQLERLSSLPIDELSINLVLHDRLELPSTDYKTVILPRELIEQIKQDAFCFHQKKSF